MSMQMHAEFTVQEGGTWLTTIVSAEAYEVALRTGYLTCAPGLEPLKLVAIKLCTAEIPGEEMQIIYSFVSNQFHLVHTEYEISVSE